ncbi:MAG: glucuronate isomerase [Spirochaetales bacterium]|nr:glucuronate isomerase [Spirochaetales bacterium]
MEANKTTLLVTPEAQSLYHDVAAPLPLIDRCLPAVAGVRGWNGFATPCEAWIRGDVAKITTMRAVGVDERICTGETSPRELFAAWAAVLPRIEGTELWMWSQQELQQYFSIDLELSPKNAKDIWSVFQKKGAGSSQPQDKNLLIAEAGRPLFPSASLDEFPEIQESQYAETTLKPVFNLSPIFDFSDLGRWIRRIRRLGNRAGGGISCWEDLLEVLMVRHAAFHAAGCRLSVHGTVIESAVQWTPGQANAVLKTALAGTAPNKEETALFSKAVMESCAMMDAGARWTTELTVQGKLQKLSEGLIHHLSGMAEWGMLPKTVLMGAIPTQEGLNQMNQALGSECAEDILFAPTGHMGLYEGGLRKFVHLLGNQKLLSRLSSFRGNSAYFAGVRHQRYRQILCSAISSLAQKGLIDNAPASLENHVREACLGADCSTMNEE